MREFRKYIAGVVQLDSQDNEEENLQKIRTGVEEASAKGARLVVLPETVHYIGKNMKGHAVKIPGPLTDFFAELAVKHRIYLHCGSITEENSTGKPYNTSLLICPDGDIIGKYRKLHLFDIDMEEGPSVHESHQLRGGNEVVAVHTAIGTIGFAVCYDIRFPEMFKLMSQNGANIFLICANFTKQTGQAHWEALLRARAIENTCYVIACGQTGEKEKYTAYGNSMMIDPWGSIIARADEKEQVILSEIDQDLIDEVRKQMPSLKNNRQDVYEVMGKSVKIY